jgi:hypothetical protein
LKKIKASITRKLSTHIMAKFSFDRANLVRLLSENYPLLSVLIGFLLVSFSAGPTSSYSAGSQDCWLVRVDAAGNLIWSKTYGGTGSDGVPTMIQTYDGGFAFFGPTMSFGAGAQDAWLVKVDSNGNIQWNKTYGGTANEYAVYIIQTADRGYTLAGGTMSSGAGGEDVWLIKTDTSGNMLWNTTWGGPNNEEAYSLCQANDGSYVIVAYTRSFGFGTATPASSDWYLIKTSTEFGLTQIDSSANSITLYRGTTDPYWNFVRVRIWKTT